MAKKFVPPSFSLGLDLDSDSDHDPPRPKPEDENEVEIEKDGFDRPDPVPAFKRLRKGLPEARSQIPPVRPPFSGGGEEVKIGSLDAPCLEDDIEEVSSQEDFSVRDVPSKQNYSVCSSLKVSLQGSRILCTQSGGKSKGSSSTPHSNITSSMDLELNTNKRMFPKLTVSPLRKLRFSDSDVEDSSPCNTKQNESEKNFFNKNRSWNPTNTDNHCKVKKAKISPDNDTTETWRDLNSTKCEDFATPALDKFCEEYFRSMKQPCVGQAKETLGSTSGSRVHDPTGHILGSYESYQKDDTFSIVEQHHWNLPDPEPPSYLYFFHNDPRIQKLVRERLLNFVPLGASPGAEQHPGVDCVDYMCQYGSQSAPVRATKASAKAPCKRPRKKKINQVAAEDPPHPSTGFVNPRSSVVHQENATNKRNCGNGQTSGHWYTDQNGRKVYVAKNGQELSGQSAYRHYRKESGAGFKKSKKKSAPRRTKSSR